MAVGAPETETAGDDEWDLDTQYSTGMAPGVGVLNVYIGNSLVGRIRNRSKRLTAGSPKTSTAQGQLLGRRV